MNSFIKQASSYLFLLTLLIASPVFAKTQIEIDSDTASFKDEKLKAGSIEVAVNFSSLNSD